MLTRKRKRKLTRKVFLCEEPQRGPLEAGRRARGGPRDAAR